VAAARPPAPSSGRPRHLPAAAPSSGRPRHFPPIGAVSRLTIVSYATCTAVVTLRLAKSAARHCKFTPDAAMLRTLRRRDDARTQVRSPSRMGQLWPNKIRHRLLSARPEFPYNNHAAHGRYGQILLTEDLSREHDRQRREWRGLIALSAVIPRPCATSERRVCRGQQAFPARSGQLGDHLLTSAPGRSRTDTGDPFRGPASSLGLRGLGNNTPERLSDSRAAELIQNVSPGGSYLFSLRRRMQSVTISITFDGVCLRSVTGPPQCAETTSMPAFRRARLKTVSSMAGVTRPVNVFC
jgi:hypothetical protein